MVVTKLTWGKKNKDRVNVYIDEAYLFSLSYDLCIQEGLKKGMELSEEKIEELRGADTAQKVRQKALHLLSYRPHSQKELAQKLAKGRINPSLAQSAASYAADRGYQSDREYADMYVRHMTKKGLSNRRIGWELSQRGIQGDC
jgi:regulatory protein